MDEIVLYDKNRNLYEILQASPTATRAELKKNYIALSKTLHPDAKLSYSNNNATTTLITPPECTFSDVATAWRILSNPTTRKRYDRTLFAGSLTKNFDKAATGVSSVAGPMVNALFEKVALPALRRTAAAATAAVDSAKDDLSNRDFESVVSNAVRAGVESGKVIDNMDLDKEVKKIPYFLQIKENGKLGP
eukprot:CAMPEP_0172487534 /NCGR_PEP_ID=MMETSP1066-20121228/16681_1 /TAXON_ID=671091 /ORGANISM="Coscinodiscus wailesii, Strain CCMP2513" /LENGTH=190 /DNA_ID=CAMNT_0013254223 /DNA_START=294 /DNA_END=866 /DNA_ORIENTATION=+